MDGELSQSLILSIHCSSIANRNGCYHIRFSLSQTTKPVAKCHALSFSPALRRSGDAYPGILLFCAIMAPVLATHDPEATLIGKEDVKQREAPVFIFLGCAADKPEHYFGLMAICATCEAGCSWCKAFAIGWLYFSGLCNCDWHCARRACWLSGRLDGQCDHARHGCAISVPQPDPDDCHCDCISPGLVNTLIAIGVVSIPSYARVVRASVLSIKEMDYITADRSIGTPAMRILFSHVMPNALTPLVVQATLGIAGANSSTPPRSPSSVLAPNRPPPNGAR